MIRCSIRFSGAVRTFVSLLLAMLIITYAFAGNTYGQHRGLYRAWNDILHTVQVQ